MICRFLKILTIASLTLIITSTLSKKTEAVDTDWIVIPVQALLVSDDDGERLTYVSSKEIEHQISFANLVFEQAHIRFEFVADATNPGKIKNSIINSAKGESDDNWLTIKTEGNRLADLFPGKLLLLYRHGAGKTPTTDNFSGQDYNFIVMPKYQADKHCGHLNHSSLARAIATFLGLKPTNGLPPFKDKPELKAHFDENEGNEALYDGDGLSDTFPDPAIEPYACDKTKTVTLGNKVFLLPRSNIMSQYDERKSLTPEQIIRVRWSATERLKRKMKAPTNTPFSLFEYIYEAQTLEATEATCQFGPQEMTEYGLESWNENNQLGIQGTKGCKITLQFNSEKTGKNLVFVSSTRAPSYGKMLFAVNNAKNPIMYDGYAPFITPSGNLNLGKHILKKGPNTITVTIFDKNSLSVGYNAGIDAIATKHLELGVPPSK